MSKSEKDFNEEEQQTEETREKEYTSEEEEQQNKENQQEEVVESEKLEELRETLEDLDKEEIIERFIETYIELEERDQELERQKDARLRKVAELENMKKRMQRERSEMRNKAKIEAIEDFLPINDDLRRTLNASEGLEIDDKFLDGVKMVAEKFERVLNENGVERIDETMVPFDVDKHEAMMRQPAEDEDVESNTVLQVLENGYRIGDHTIRHAKVIVSE